VESKDADTESKSEKVCFLSRKTNIPEKAKKGKEVKGIRIQLPKNPPIP
jgi:hypothetical protein